MNSFRSVVRDESNSLTYNCCFSLHAKWQDRIKTTHRSSGVRSRGNGRAGVSCCGLTGSYRRKLG